MNTICFTIFICLYRSMDNLFIHTIDMQVSIILNFTILFYSGSCPRTPSFSRTKLYVIQKKILIREHKISSVHCFLIVSNQHTTQVPHVRYFFFMHFKINFFKYNVKYINKLSQKIKISRPTNFCQYCASLTNY